LWIKNSACGGVLHRVYISEPGIVLCRSCLLVVFVVYFLKSYVGFAEFAGVKILYTLALFPARQLRFSR
jgi:hypothetical protein